MCQLPHNKFCADISTLVEGDDSGVWQSSPKRGFFKEKLFQVQFTQEDEVIAREYSNYAGPRFS